MKCAHCGKEFDQRRKDHIYCSSNCGSKASQKRLKLEVIKEYGGKCECCGETAHEFLALDHRHGGGTKLRKAGKLKGGTDSYRLAKKEGFPKDKYRLLCHNCNMAFGHYGRCPPHENLTKEK